MVFNKRSISVTCALWLSAACAAAQPAPATSAETRAAPADKATYLARVSSLLKKQWPGNRIVTGRLVCNYVLYRACLR